MSLSVIIPTCNRPRLLRRAITSALHATPEEGEILIVNDGQEALAREAVAQFDDPRLHLIENRGAKGPAGARNFGIEHSVNDVFLFLDDDDELLPGYPNYVLARHRTGGSDYGFSGFLEVIDADGDPVSGSGVPRRKPYPEGEVPQTKKFKDRVAGFGMGFWLTRSAYESVGALDVTLQTSEDIDYQCRLIIQGKRGWYSDALGVNVHRHSAPTDRSHQMKIIGYKVQANDFQRIIGKHLPLLLTDTVIRRYLAQRYIKSAARAGNGAEAFTYLRKSGLLRLTPILVPYYLQLLLLRRL